MCKLKLFIIFMPFQFFTHEKVKAANWCKIFLIFQPFKVDGKVVLFTLKK